MRQPGIEFADTILDGEVRTKKVSAMIKASFFYSRQHNSTGVHDYALVNQAIIRTGVIGTPSNVS